MFILLVSITIFMLIYVQNYNFNITVSINEKKKKSIFFGSIGGTLIECQVCTIRICNRFVVSERI